MSRPDTRTIFDLNTKALVEELRTPDFGGVLAYGADCIRRCAKRHEAEDPTETSVHRANMRTLARRLDRVAKSLKRNSR